MMLQVLPIGITEGMLLFVVSILISLAVFAVNAKVNSAKLEGRLEMRELELKIEREYIKPAFDSLLGMVRHVEEQLNLRDEVREGFQQVQAALKKRRFDDTAIDTNGRNS